MTFKDYLIENIDDIYEESEYLDKLGAIKALNKMSLRKPKKPMKSFSKPVFSKKFLNHPRDLDRTDLLKILSRRRRGR